MSHRDAIGAQQPVPGPALLHSPVGNHVHGRRRHDFALRGLGNHRPHRALQLGEGVGAATQRRRPFRPQDAALPQLHVVDPRQQPVVGHERGVELVEILAEIGLQRPVAGDEIDGTVRLVVAVGGVQQYLITAPDQLDVEGVPLLADPGVVHVVAHRILALRDQLQRLVPHQPPRVGLVFADSRYHGVTPVPLEHLQQPLLRAVGRRHQRPRVALQQVGVPGVAQDDAVGLFVQPAGVDDLDRRHQRPVVEYLRVRRPDAAGPRTAQVPEMGEGMTVGHHLSMEEHRRDEHHVRRVRDAALGQVRVVVPVQVAGLHLLHRIVVPHAAQNVAAHGVAVDLPPAGVQEAHGVVLLLPNERRHRRALDDQLALQPGGPQRTADQLPGHRVDRLDLVGLVRENVGVAFGNSHVTLRWRA